MDLAAENPVDAALGEVERRLSSRAEIELSILMPCLNEAETLATCIDKATGVPAGAGSTARSSIADNGCTDGSQEIAASAGARVVEVPSRGYGAALIAGIAGGARQDTSSWATPTTATTSPSSTRFVDEAARGRRPGHGQPLQGRDRARRRCRRCTATSATRCCRFIGRLFFRSPIGDFHCGLRGFRATRSLGLDLARAGMEFA